MTSARVGYFSGYYLLIIYFHKKQVLYEIIFKSYVIFKQSFTKEFLRMILLSCSKQPSKMTLVGNIAAQDPPSYYQLVIIQALPGSRVNSSCTHYSGREKKAH